MPATDGFTGPLLGGRYRLGPRLGRGTQGETFVARDELAKPSTADREVIVKRVIPRGTWKSFELFEREAKVLSQLRHAGVPRHIATLEEPPGTFNLVMQRMPGDNLRELTQRRRLSELELRELLVRALEILDYLHTRAPSVIHRDIKPSNLVKAPGGQLALVDFGGVLDAARESGGSTIVGTYGYMAPEQLHGEVTPATDIYALGATIVALAGGVEPETVPRKGLRMDLAKHLPHLDRTLRDTLAKMTEPEPEKRPQRARDVLAILAKGPQPRADAPDGGKRSPTPRLGVDAFPHEQALVKQGDRALAPPRRMFPDTQEPLATALRLGVLAFGAGGWVGVSGIRLAVFLCSTLFAVLAFPARRQVRHVGRELDAMLLEGQSGFTDLMRDAMARKPQP